jgi:hypothetical protein
MVRWLVIAAASVIAIAFVVTVVGFFLPEAHVASRQASYHAPPSAIFAVITDVSRYAEWRNDVREVQVLSVAPQRWREKGTNGEITFEVQETRSPERLVVRIADPNLPFGGTWTYELHPTGGATRLVITERGEVYNPVFRFMSRFIFSQTATIDRFLTALGSKLGQEVTPAEV